MIAIQRSSSRNYEPAGLNLHKFIGSMLGKIRNDGKIDILLQDSLAEWSKALAPGASPQGLGIEPHSCHFLDSEPISSVPKPEAQKREPYHQTKQLMIAEEDFCPP